MPLSDAKRCKAIAKRTGRRCRVPARTADGYCLNHSPRAQDRAQSLEVLKRYQNQPGHRVIEKYSQQRYPPKGLTMKRRAQWRRNRDRAIAAFVRKHGHRYTREDIRRIFGYELSSMRKMPKRVRHLTRAEKIARFVRKYGARYSVGEIAARFGYSPKAKGSGVIHALRARGMTKPKMVRPKKERGFGALPEQQAIRSRLREEMNRVERQLERLIAVLPYDTDIFAAFAMRLRRLSLIMDAFRYAVYRHDRGWGKARERVGKKYVYNRSLAGELASIFEALAPNALSAYARERMTAQRLEALLSGAEELAWWRRSIAGPRPKTGSGYRWLDFPDLDNTFFKARSQTKLRREDFLRFLKIAQETGWSWADFMARVRATTQGGKT